MDTYGNNNDLQYNCYDISNNFVTSYSYYQLHKHFLDYVYIYIYIHARTQIWNPPPTYTQTHTHTHTHTHTRQPV